MLIRTCRKIRPFRRCDVFRLPHWLMHPQMSFQFKRRLKTMAKRTYPLELVLRAHGPAELLNADEDTLWASDSDDDFREEFNNEFLEEEDIGDILEFLLETDVINDKEFDHFANENWACNIETLENEVKGPDDDEDDDDED
jgi:hypothetical protein